MERLTEERGERTYQLYHLSWYLNIIVAFALVLVAGYVWASDTPFDGRLTDMLLIMIIATIAFVGAGISRYQSRLEGQHLEIKLAINRLTRQVETMINEKKD